MRCKRWFKDESSIRRNGVQDDVAQIRSPLLALSVALDLQVPSMHGLPTPLPNTIFRRSNSPALVFFVTMPPTKRKRSPAPHMLRQVSSALSTGFASSVGTTSGVAGTEDDGSDNKCVSARALILPSLSHQPCVLGCLSNNNGPLQASSFHRLCPPSRRVQHCAAVHPTIVR